jgi:hypothetical protein
VRAWLLSPRLVRNRRERNEHIQASTSDNCCGVRYTIGFIECFPVSWYCMSASLIIYTLFIYIGIIYSMDGFVYSSQSCF